MSDNLSENSMTLLFCLRDVNTRTHSEQSE